MTGEGRGEVSLVAARWVAGEASSKPAPSES
jgi:hypothetical protein